MPLSRTSSRESNASCQIPQSLLLDNGPPSSANSSNLPSPVRTESPKASLPLPQWSRTPSHSLLSTSSSPSASVTSRKSRFADVGTTSAIGRASISMPPPMTNPPSNYKPSVIRRPSAALVKGDGLGTFNAMEGSSEARVSNESAMVEDLEKTPSLAGSQANTGSETYAPLTLPDSTLKPFASSVPGADVEGNRLSFSSLYSLGSAIYSGATGGSSIPSAASSNAGSVNSGGLEPPSITSLPMSPSLGSAKGEASSSATTATDPVSVTANSHSPHAVPLRDTMEPVSGPPNAASKHLDSWSSGPLPRPHAPRRSRSRTQRQASSSNVNSSAASPNSSDRSSQAKAPIGLIGVCALDIKARSKASRNILTRLQSNGEFEVVVFGDKVILDEDVENWPICDFLISFFSDGFPLEKAIAYARLRKPFCINDLPMQKILWDRRICLRILDCMGVPTPKRLEVNRDGGPMLESADLAEHVFKLSGVKLPGPVNGTGGGMPIAKNISMIEEGDTLLVDGVTLQKPFVEKPVSGEDHNIRIYFPKDHDGGGGRKLFRKIGNKSSEWDPELTIPRAISEEGSSYIYEQFLHVDNAEDIKAYTVGPDFCHAETRKSPVVDGLVRRNTHGKEIRYITSLTKDESLMAKKIANGFGQRICGFDLLRVGPKSFVIDVNGWSFVKDNNEYYDNCARILKSMFLTERQRRDGGNPIPDAIVDKVPDTTQPPRKHATGSHRSALKTMMKSPSMSRLTGHHHSVHRSHGTSHGTSPDMSNTTVPLSSPPSIDRRSVSTSSKNRLPPPVIPTPANDPGTPEASKSDDVLPASVPQPASKHSWKLKGMVSVIRHADRTPKQKFKFTFHTQPFVDLLKGHQEEVLLKGEAALSSVLDAVKVALEQGEEDPDKLQLLRTSLARKGAWTGTKVQIKPMFRKRKREETRNITSNDVDENTTTSPIVAEELTADPEESSEVLPPNKRNDSLAGVTLSRFSAAENDLVLDKLQLIIKWGGEPTHSARYQSHDLGENMRNDLLLMNKEALDDVRVFTSSERRVSTSAQIWTTSFLNQKEVAPDKIVVRKDLLDDSNAAKDVMDKVKKRLKLLLREGHQAPPQFAWPANMPEPSIVVRKVVELMTFHRKVMRHNFKKLNGGAAASLTALNKLAEGHSATPAPAAGALSQAQNVASIQARWCCGEDPELFKERWEKLFAEFCDSEKVDPSKISELYDTMKFDALHNRQFLEFIFTPSTSMLADDTARDANSAIEVSFEEPKKGSAERERRDSNGAEKAGEQASPGNIAHRMGFRRKSMMNSQSPQANPQEESQEPYFKLFSGTGQTKAKQDARLGKLRELYKLAKVLFDFVCPQEYGISDSEKLEIGLLTSLPLLKEIVKDLEEVQASEDAKSFIYFTKESHIYTLLNCILEGGIKTKIERNAIPELDYLSTISFELYESEDKDEDTFAYSIRITITPGCHTFDPLDVQLDSKHSIGCAQRRSLTAHADWKEVIETLRAKFHTVKLPKSFLAVNVSESHVNDTSSSAAASTTSAASTASLED